MTKEEILDIFYENGMHWKRVNRERVLEAMSEYASQCTAPLEARIRELEQRDLLWQKLSDAHKAYLRLLNDECTELMGLAYAHGWKSSRYAEGVVCRTHIDDIEQAIKQVLGLSSSSSDGWIKVDKDNRKFPEWNRRILVIVGGDDEPAFMIFSCVDDYRTQYMQDFLNHCKYWRYLPKPPKNI